MIVYIIDNLGFYLGFNTVEASIEQDLSFIEIAPSIDLLKPKWNGEVWIEGAATEEIDSHNSEILLQKKKEAHDLLKETDWYVIRFQETGKLIPQDILDIREQIRNNY